jgi:dsRNA-specific ribonuclease
VLNKFVKGESKDIPSKYSAYKTLLTELDAQTETFKMRTYSSLAGMSFEQILGALELVHTAITDARDFREKKVQSIIKIFEKTRLDSVKNLTEKVSKD